MSVERRRSGTNLYPVYSSDEDEKLNYVNDSRSGRKARRSSSFRDNTPGGASDYRRKSLVGNKSSNGDMDPHANQGASSDDFDALFVLKTIITIGIGVAAGLFGAVLCVSVLQHCSKPPLEGDYLQCSNSQTLCIPDANTSAVLDVVVALQNNLTTEAGLAECYPDVYNTANITINDVMTFAPQVSDREVRTFMKYVAWIIVANPSWNLRLYNSSGGQVDTLRYVVDKSLVVKSTQFSRPLSCVVNQWMMFMWYSVWYIIIGLLLALVGFYSYLWYVNKKHQQQQAVFVMVDNIIDVLILHHKSSSKNKDLLPYLAISHVRDMLIPPSERVHKAQIWQKAVDWIANSETRVRVESQMIAGEQFTVWRWIHSDPPATEVPDRGEQWQGKAFDAVSPPLCPPSVCMRLKNMFDSTIHVSPSDITAIQDALLHKCMDHGRVVHIVVDKRSLFGCVYIKLDSISTALSVYKTLHGSWFNGRLITAKYIVPERYHKWFPVAETAVRSIYPSDT
ncbi:inner nuclear membrane protein Man1-like isoform X2 [Dysidea avara]|uniref:inner nuclear membrane protein Man1-like isoform X2 n=1 Tax=Dysidea avara TaxID=196820 RepID=UPI003324D269